MIPCAILRRFLFVTMLSFGAATAAVPETRVLPLRLLSSGRYASASARPYVNVPAGTVQLVMEQRIAGVWKRIQVQDLTFAPRERTKNVFLTLPPKVPWNQLRVIGRRTPLPTMLTPAPVIYERFEDASESAIIGTGTLYPGVITIGDLRLDGAISFNTARADATTTVPSSVATTTPVEADIWKIAGNRLFFFNQYRGLQVFDLSNPAEPARLGGVRLAGRGDQLYVLDEAATTVALVAPPVRYGGKPELHIAKLKGNTPERVAHLSLDGRIIDSRLIGDRLYLLTHTDLPQVLSSFQSNCTLVTVDLSNPTAPVLEDTLPLGPSYISQLQASGRYLLVAVRAPDPLMHIIDIGGERPALLKSVPLKAPVQDKFKMGVVNGAAVAVTSGVFNSREETWVETFAIDGPETAPLAQLELEGARNERLFGTRFDGDRLYVVTLFVRLARDPLFIVDLADPAAPVVRAALEIPGWSTYLEPHGDRVVAIGIQDGRVAVSLFDVANAEAPTLASRLLLGTNWSSSEATSNEKAVEYYPETGTLLVPFNDVQGRTSIQVVQVGRDTLTPGMVIPHDGTARRGAAVANHLVSISGSELRVVNAAAKTPEPVAEVSLAWRVDRVLVFGNRLVQIDDGSGWSFDGHYTGQRCLVRISRQDDPDALLEELDLGSGRIVGTAQKGNRIYLAQWLPNNDGNHATLKTWVLDLSNPSQAEVAATVEHKVQDPTWPEFALGQVEGLWPTPANLVWHLPVTRYRPLLRLPPIFLPQPQPITILPALRSDFILTGTVRLTSALDTAVSPDPVTLKEPTLAVVLCPVKLTGNSVAAGPAIRLSAEEPVRGNSRPLIHDGAVYVSYDAIGPFLTNPDGSQNASRRRIRSWLQVVNFNGAEPQPAAPVSIPGELLELTQGLTGGEQLLITRAGERSAHFMNLQASAFNGSTATLLKTHEVPANVSGAFTSVEGKFLYFGTRDTPTGVVGYRFDAASRTFSQVGSWTMQVTPGILKALPRVLLVSNYEHLDTARIASGGALTPAASFDTPPGSMMQVERLTEGAGGIFVPALDYGVEFLSLKDLEGK